jgi:LysM repeat protein
MVWRDTGLPWVAPSPNIPRADSPLYSAATGLFGEIAGSSGINIGNMIRRPFECVCASWLNASLLSQTLASRLPDVRFPPLRLNVDGRRYHGVEIKFADAAHAPLVAINYHLVDAIRQTTGRNIFAEAVQHGRSFALFDKANGTDKIRLALQAGHPAAQITRTWRAGEDAFRRQRQPYLLYPSGPIAASPPGGAPQAGPPLGPASVTPVPPPRRAGASPTTNHLVVTVSRGDTLTKIAQDFRVSLNDIVEANPHTNVFELKVGQKLRVPRPPVPRQR